MIVSHPNLNRLLSSRNPNSRWNNLACVQFFGLRSLDASSSPVYRGGSTPKVMHFNWHGSTHATQMCTFELFPELIHEVSVNPLKGCVKSPKRYTEAHYSLMISITKYFTDKGKNK